MTTYTVTNRHGTVEGRYLTLTEAAEVILTYDGFTHEIRRVEGYDQGDESQWELMVSDGSRASVRGAGHMKSTLLSIGPVYAASEDDAWSKLAERVCTQADLWSGLSCMTDDAYDALQAESAAGEGQS